jgi:hypothetical protein
MLDRIVIGNKECASGNIINLKHLPFDFVRICLGRGGRMFGCLGKLFRYVFEKMCCTINYLLTLNLYTLKLELSFNTHTIAVALPRQFDCY